jgi:hypothetical protein
LGSLEKSYTKQDLDDATGYTGQYWGFDVTQDGKTFVLGGAQGKAWELAVTAQDELRVSISRSGNNVILSWPGSISGVVIESTPTLSPVSFAEIVPQPVVTMDQGQNTATIPIGTGSMFFRLKK